MPRRASSSSNPLWIVGGIVILAVVIAAGYFIGGFVSDPYRTLTPLDVQTYLDNSNSLRGNVYKLDGTVDNQLAWSPTTGRVYSVIISTPSGDQPLPILVPVQFNQINMQKGQHFVLKVEVGDQGILHVLDMRKA